MRFGGYYLDKRQRPTFMYSLQSVEIEDYAEALELEGKTWLRRKLSLSTEESMEGLWFRAAAGRTIDRHNNGEFMIDGKLLLTLKGERKAEPIVRGTAGRSELVVPVRFEAGKASLSLEYTWGS